MRVLTIKIKAPVLEFISKKSVIHFINVKTNDFSLLPLQSSIRRLFIYPLGNHSVAVVHGTIRTCTGHARDMHTLSLNTFIYKHIDAFFICCYQRPQSPIFKCVEIIMLVLEKCHRSVGSLSFNLRIHVFLILSRMEGVITSRASTSS